MVFGGCLRVGWRRSLAAQFHPPPPSQLHFNPRGGVGAQGRAGGQCRTPLSTQSCLCVLLCAQGSCQPARSCLGVPGHQGCSDKSFWSL